MSYYAAVVLGDKPSGYWRLGEASGTTAFDQTSNHYDGTLHGGITLAQPGLLQGDADTCKLFNGSSGYISLPAGAFPTGSAAWSVDFWFSISSLPGGFAVPFNMGGNSNLHNVQIAFQASDNTINFFSWSTGRVIIDVATASFVYYLAVTYDGTTVRLYRNGQFDNSIALALNLDSATAYIGNDNTTDWFPGLVDELAIYKGTTLSAAQIKNHFLAGMAALDFPVVAIGMTARDGITATQARDGLGLVTKARG